MLINRIQNQGVNRLWLSIPELVDWTVVEGFKYKPSNAPPIHDDVHMKDFIDEGKPRSGKFTLDFFKRNEIYAVLPDGTINDDWSVFRCIYCELDHQNETFLLTSGRWYRVGADFLNRINDFYSTMPTPEFALPNYKDKSEPVYTARCRE